MKQNLLFLAIIGFSLIGCNNSADKKSKNQETSALEAVEETQTNENPQEENYIITSEGVGHIKKDNDLIKLNPGEIRRTEDKEITEEGITFTSHFDYILDKNNETLVEINDRGIWVLSGNYHTERGISVGSDYQEFTETYPDAKVQYSYVSDMFWLSTGELEWVEFILPNDAYTGNDDKLTQSDLVDISAENIKKDAGIVKIRIF